MNQALTLPNLPPAVSLEVLRLLRPTLPPPVGETDEEREAREAIAMGAVASLRPETCFEALLAAQIVAANAHAMDCFGRVVLRCKEPDVARRYAAQGAVMMNAIQGAMRGLQRTQAIRAKAEAAGQPAAMAAAGWWFRDASVPEEVAAADPGEAPPQAEVAGESAAEVAGGEAVTDFALEAERYAVIYPARAALIRAHGGLPPRIDFGPPEAELVAALVNGTSPALLALDRRTEGPRVISG